MLGESFRSGGAQVWVIPAPEESIEDQQLLDVQRKLDEDQQHYAKGRKKAEDFLKLVSFFKTCIHEKNAAVKGL